MRIANSLIRAFVCMFPAMFLTGVVWVMFSGRGILTPAGVPHPVLAWLLFGIGAIAALFGFVANYLYEWDLEQRTAANQALAERYQLEFTAISQEPAWPAAILRQVAPLYGASFSQACQGVCGGMDVNIVDVRYTSGGSESETTHHHTAFAWRIPNASFPEFSMCPRSLGGSLASFLCGSQGLVNFDAASTPGPDAFTVEQFNQRYEVASSASTPAEELALRKLFTPQTMRALLDAGDLHVTAAEGVIACWRNDKRYTGDDREGQWLQMTALLKVLNVAAKTESKHLVPLTIHQAPSITVWSLLPLICAVALGFLGVAIGAIPSIALAMSQHDRVPHFVFPVGIFGCMFALGGVGWLVGQQWARRLGPPR